jgi:hypothetical protein
MGRGISHLEEASHHNTCVAPPDIEKPSMCIAMHPAWVLKMAVQLPMLHDSSDAMKSTTPPMT